MTLTRIALAAVFCGVCTPLALAKRIAPKEVTPVVRDGVEYSAPLGADRIGIILARDVATKKTLWEQRISSPMPKSPQSGPMECLRRLQMNSNA